MGQPVKLSDELVLDARLVGEAAERSIAGQIEFWASLGRALEPILRGDEAVRLKRRGRVQPLSRMLDSVGTAAGRKRLERVLRDRPFPRFEPDRERPGVLIRIEADGTRTAGRFLRRRFVPVSR